MSGEQPGIGVDAHGVPVIDPTDNVRELVIASDRRSDDLATERQLRLEEAIAHVKEIGDIRAHHAAELRTAESERIDAIRKVDIGNVERAAEAQAAQASVLATQVAVTAETLRLQVATVTDPLRAAIEDLRRSQYEAQGMKSQTTESRLSVGAVVAALSLVAAVLFGVAGIVIAVILKA